MNNAFKPLLVVFAVVLALAGISYWRGTSAGGHDNVPWRASLAEARAEAAKSKKPIVLYFTASWCPPCQEMKENTWPDARVAEALKDFVPVKADVDQLPDLAREFDVRNIPRLQIIWPDGTLGPSHVGGISPEDLIEWLHGLRRA
jgi:thiol:disulfide interchange protein